jgi:hypothetical protein
MTLAEAIQSPIASGTSVIVFLLSLSLRYHCGTGKRVKSWSLEFLVILDELVEKAWQRAGNATMSLLGKCHIDGWREAKGIDGLA